MMVFAELYTPGLKVLEEENLGLGIAQGIHETFPLTAFVGAW